MLTTKHWFACMSWSILGNNLMGKVREELYMKM